MADEEEYSEESETPVVESKQDKRLKDLSEKVKLTSEERDEKDKLLQEQTAQLEASQKETEFYKTFNTLTANTPGASEYQDTIKEKVMAGYEMEDAINAVLAKEGKLPGMTQIPIAQDSPAGGSSSTTLSSGEKNVGDMTQAERRAELSKLSPEEMQGAFRSASSL